MALLNNICILILLCELVVGQVYCPDSAEILPCTCSENGIEDVTMDCSSAQTEEDIDQAFLADFSFKNLTTFSISNNDALTELTRNLFGDITFQKIDIQKTSISSIDSAFLDSSVGTLIAINCNGNALSDFPLDDLSRYSSLINLFMGDNELTALPKLASTTIQTMDFGINSIESIADFAFRDCPSLITLLLHVNRITELAPSTFLNAMSLSIIFLQLNDIQSLRTGTFTGLAKLQELYLNSNPITIIEDAAFFDLPSLFYLNLDNIQSEGVRRENLYEVHGVTEFHMDSSIVQTIEPYTFIDFEEDIVHIYLNNNNISVIVDNAFAGLFQGEIDLYNNQISEIQSGAFRDTSNSVLDLHQNLMTTLDESWLGPIFEANNDVAIWDNPLECGCDIAWLFRTPKLLDQLTGTPSCNNGTYIALLNSDFYLNNC